MEVQNLKLMTCPFDEYLSLPGWSYSGIKNDGAKVIATPKMQLGTAVHNCLLAPEEERCENAALARPIAKALAAVLGPLLAALKPELAITADFIHAGFRMAYKGRIDLAIPGRLVVDIKVTEMKDLAAFIKFFGTDYQLNGYGIGIKAKTILMLSIHPKTFKTNLINIPLNTYWWEQEVKKRGEVIYG